jgi:hypothetical protein
MDDARERYRFAGFDTPNYTPIPDVFFDEVMCHLTEAELRVALYIMRRTFGFKKRADAISFNQFLKGITTRDGRRLDHGCGIAGRTNLTRALKGLEEKGLIVARRSTSARGDAQTTVYELRFKDTGVVPERDHPHHGAVPERDHPPTTVVAAEDYPGDPGSPPVVIERDSQETVPHETVNNITDDSKAEGGNCGERGVGEPARTLTEAIDAVSVALGDARHQAANRTRAVRLLAGLTDEYAAQVAGLALNRVTALARTGGVQNRIAYFFAVLDDLARQAGTPAAGAPARPASLAGRYGHLVQR